MAWQRTRKRCKEFSAWFFFFLFFVTLLLRWGLFSLFLPRYRRWHGKRAKISRFFIIRKCFLFQHSFWRTTLFIYTVRLIYGTPRVFTRGPHLNGGSGVRGREQPCRQWFKSKWSRNKEEEIPKFYVGTTWEIVQILPSQAVMDNVPFSPHFFFLHFFFYFFFSFSLLAGPNQNWVANHIQLRRENCSYITDNGIDAKTEERWMIRLPPPLLHHQQHPARCVRRNDLLYVSILVLSIWITFIDMAGGWPKPEPRVGPYCARHAQNHILARKLIHNSSANRRRWSVINFLVDIYTYTRKRRQKEKNKNNRRIICKCSTRFILSHRESLTERNCLSVLLLFAQLISVQREWNWARSVPSWGWSLLPNRVVSFQSIYFPFLWFSLCLVL